MLRLVLPVLLEQFLALTVGFTDKWLAGNLFAEAEPLAAVGLVAYCLAFLPVPFAVPAVAVTALVARAVGSGDAPAARRAAAQALLVGLAIVAGFIMRRSVFGRHVYAVGSSEPAARLCGVRVQRVKLWLYTLAGAFFGLAGLMQQSRLAQGDCVACVARELN